MRILQRLYVAFAFTSCSKVKVNTNKIEYWQQVKLEKSKLVSARCITYVSYCLVKYKSLRSEYYLLNAQWHYFQMFMSGNTSGEITMWKNVQQFNYILSRAIYRAPYWISSICWVINCGQQSTLFQNLPYFQKWQIYSKDTHNEND